MTADKQSLRQQILAQIDRCAELAYGAGHHYAKHFTLGRIKAMEARLAELPQAAPASAVVELKAAKS